MSLSLLLFVIALVLFVLAAIGVSTRFNLGWAGMACLAASMIAGGLVLS